MTTSRRLSGDSEYDIVVPYWRKGENILDMHLSVRRFCPEVILRLKRDACSPLKPRRVARILATFMRRIERDLLGCVVMLDLDVGFGVLPRNVVNRLTASLAVDCRVPWRQRSGRRVIEVSVYDICSRHATKSHACE